jgi:predicted SprT family Zn-dependent metalloprotease
LSRKQAIKEFSIANWEVFKPTVYRCECAARKVKVRGVNDTDYRCEDGKKVGKLKGHSGAIKKIMTLFHIDHEDIQQG